MYETIIKECEPSQTHSELEALLELVEPIKPKYILEIGVHRGGSLRVWQRVFNPITLIGIDTRPEREAFIDGAFVLTGNSTHDNTLRTVKKMLDEPLDFLFIDGSHYYPDVKKDFEMYYPLVRDGGAIAFHDVILTGNDTCEVNRYWNEIKDKYNSVTISHKDRWGVTATGVGLIWK